jgi:hypothetical protein
MEFKKLKYAKLSGPNVKIINDNFDIATLGQEVGTTPGTLAAGDDSRIVGIDLENLDAADPLTGAEKLPGLQSGVAVALTSDEISGSPLSTVMSLAKNKIRSFSHFEGTSSTYSSSTTGTLFGLEPFEIWTSGTTGAAISQAGSTVLLYGCADLSTGTNPAGYAAITSTHFPLMLSATSNKVDFRLAAGPNVLPTAGQNYTLQIGIFTVPSAAATKGVFFRATSASLNWFAYTKNGTGAAETITDTGVAVAAKPLFTNTTTFRASYDSANTETVFYINGVEAARQTATNLPVGTFLYAGAAIFKTAGSTARSLYVDAASLEVNDSSYSVEHF